MRRSHPLVQKARALRRAQTREEESLWHLVRRRSLGFKFRRQHPFDWFVLDFYCPAARLAIELDGKHHDEERDSLRDEQLAAKGIMVLRLENHVVREQPDQVIEAIRALAAARVALREPADRPSMQPGDGPS
jgi:very-short-patch-repair endonuclease